MKKLLQHCVGRTLPNVLDILINPWTGVIDTTVNDELQYSVCLAGVEEKLTHLAPTALMFLLTTAVPTAFGVDLISGGKVAGGVFGPVALAVLAMMKKR